MIIGGVETNIENQEQYEELIKRMLEWFVARDHPGWRIKQIRLKGRVIYDRKENRAAV